MNTGAQTMKCIVEDCRSEAVITTPVPLCAMDAIRVAAVTERALEVEAKMSRVQALTAIKSSPLATNADLAERTGWPAEWVKSHRESIAE